MRTAAAVVVLGGEEHRVVGVEDGAIWVKKNPGDEERRVDWQSVDLRTTNPAERFAFSSFDHVFETFCERMDRNQIWKPLRIALTSDTYTGTSAVTNYLQRVAAVSDALLKPGFQYALDSKITRVGKNLEGIRHRGATLVRKKSELSTLEQTKLNQFRSRLVASPRPLRGQTPLAVAFLSKDVEVTDRYDMGRVRYVKCNGFISDGAPNTFVYEASNEYEDAVFEAFAIETFIGTTCAGIIHGPPSRSSSADTIQYEAISERMRAVSLEPVFQPDRGQPTTVAPGVRIPDPLESEAHAFLRKELYAQAEEAAADVLAAASTSPLRARLITATSAQRRTILNRAFDATLSMPELLEPLWVQTEDGAVNFAEAANRGGRGPWNLPLELSGSEAAERLGELVRRATHRLINNRVFRARDGELFAEQLRYPTDGPFFYPPQLSREKVLVDVLSNSQRAWWRMNALAEGLLHVQAAGDAVRALVASDWTAWAPSWA